MLSVWSWGSKLSVFLQKAKSYVILCSAWSRAVPRRVLVCSLQVQFNFYYGTVLPCLQDRAMWLLENICYSASELEEMFFCFCFFFLFTGSSGVSYLVPTCTDRLESEGMLFVCSSTQIFLSTDAINCAPFSWSSLM